MKYLKLNPRFVSNFDIRQLLPGLYGNTLDMSGLSSLVLPTSQSLTSPVIAGGLTASGSAANDFSGSTGTFKFPTGLVSGNKQNVISGSGATVTLTAAQSGSQVLFDRAAGIVFTLPAPSVGLYYDFYTTVSITSGAAEVDTDAGTTFVTGGVGIFPNTATSANSFIANGTSHVKISSNGSTTGGLKGGWFRMVCISSTVWLANGILMGSGTLATPFA